MSNRKTKAARNIVRLKRKYFALILIPFLIVLALIMYFLLGKQKMSNNIDCMKIVAYAANNYSTKTQEVYQELDKSYTVCNSSNTTWKGNGHSGNLAYSHYYALTAYRLNNKDQAKGIAKKGLKDYFASGQYKGVGSMSSADLSAWDDLKAIRDGQYE